MITYTSLNEAKSSAWEAAIANKAECFVYVFKNRFVIIRNFRPKQELVLVTSPNAAITFASEYKQHRQDNWINTELVKVF